MNTINLKKVNSIKVRDNSIFIDTDVNDQVELTGHEFTLLNIKGNDLWKNARFVRRSSKDNTVYLQIPRELRKDIAIGYAKIYFTGTIIIIEIYRDLSRSKQIQRM